MVSRRSLRVSSVHSLRSLLDHLAPQLSVIIESVASISSVAADEIPPTSHPLPVVNVFREDVVRPSLTAEQALAAAPAV